MHLELVTGLDEGAVAAGQDQDLELTGRRGVREGQRRLLAERTRDLGQRCGHDVLLRWMTVRAPSCQPRPTGAEPGLTALANGISFSLMTQHLSRPEGRIAYSLDGPAAGPLVVLIPGMGDLRSTWRELTGPLVEAGHRVAVMDLRGHGDSDTTFRTHETVVTGQDAIALVEHLGGPAVLVGNSMGASAAAWAAAERPDLVAGLVPPAAFLREPADAGDCRRRHARRRAGAVRPPVGAALGRPYLPRGTPTAGRRRRGSTSTSRTSRPH